LSNIYLDRLDQYVEQTLIPEYERGKRRRKNLAYHRVWREIGQARQGGGHRRARDLTRVLRRMPSQDPDDPGYRRLRYVRYCDDFLLGLAGPRHEAEEIKEKIRTFLRDQLRLELSESKTLITHAVSQAAQFLGYEIRTQHADAKITGGRRMVNGTIGLFVPKAAIRERCARYMVRGVPAQRGPLLFDEDFTIVATYGSEYRGYVQYYLLAQDVWRLGRLRWVMETSMLKTLAAKHASTVTKMARKYKTRVTTSDGPRVCFQVTVPRGRQEATGRPLRRNSPQAPAPRDHQRPETTPGHHPRQRAYPPAPRRTVRALRVTRGAASPPRAETRRSRQAREARATGVDPTDGQAQTQDPRGLRTLPP
jgi:hypothetical protein